LLRLIVDQGDSSDAQQRAHHRHVGGVNIAMRTTEMVENLCRFLPATMIKIVSRQLARQSPVIEFENLAGALASVEACRVTPA
jgi:hypothetical protein